MPCSSLIFEKEETLVKAFKTSICSPSTSPDSSPPNNHPMSPNETKPNIKDPQSLTAREFLHSKGQQAWEPNPNHDYDAFQKEFYFFYGTLMDVNHLAKVLRSPHRPHVYPAYIVGYSCKLWGPYPALVDRPAGAIVKGVAYEVQSEEEVELLQAYETDNYKPRGCSIRFLEDGKQVLGSVFKWCGGGDLLREGNFDLKDWQMGKLD